MNFTRNRLLIALVLICVSGAGAKDALAGMVKLGDPPSDPVFKTSVLRPGALPDAGEPDRPDPSPTRTSGGATERMGESTIVSGAHSLRSLAESLRWTWVIWMARYLNRID